MEHQFSMIRLIFSLICAFAGSMCFFAYLNRALFFIPRNALKKPLIILHFAAFTLLPATIGWMADIKVWWPAPAVVFAIFLCAEIHRIRTRIKHAGTPPYKIKREHKKKFNPITTFDLAVFYFQTPILKWPGENLRITHISDIHFSDSLPFEYYESVVKTALDTNPDLFVLTGDFVSRPNHLERLDILLDPLGRKKAFAILGNHDHWVGSDKVIEKIKQSGIIYLGNSSMSLTINGGKLAIAGFESPWPKRKPFTTEWESADLKIVLTHTADNIYKLAKAGADAVFAGHYHAGQIRLPHFGSIVVPSIYGRRYDHGHFRIESTDLFVTAGIGSILPRFRFLCEPDIFVVDFGNFKGSKC